MLRNEKMHETNRKDLGVVITGLTRLMSEAQSRGEIRSDIDPEALALLSMSMYEGLRQLRLIDPARVKPEMCIELLRTVLLTAAPSPAIARPHSPP
jgi:hypothetical protein